MWHMHDGVGWWMLFWMILFWGAMVALVVWGIRRISQRGGSESHPPGERDAMDIARERYARGEISKQEFDQIKQDLSFSE